MVFNHLLFVFYVVNDVIMAFFEIRDKGWQTINHITINKKKSMKELNY